MFLDERGARDVSDGGTPDGSLEGRALEGRLASLPGDHVIRILAAEDARILRIVDDLAMAVLALRRRRSAPEAERDLANVRRLTTSLAVLDEHQEREERVVFAPLRARGICTAPHVLSREHALANSLRQRLRELLAAPDPAEWAPFAAAVGSTALALVRLLREHIFKEQSVLYPHALSAIGAEEWAQLRAELDSADARARADREKSSLAP